MPLIYSRSTPPPGFTCPKLECSSFDEAGWLGGSNLFYKKNKMKTAKHVKFEKKYFFWTDIYLNEKKKTVMTTYKCS